MIGSDTIHISDLNQLGGEKFAAGNYQQVKAINEKIEKVSSLIKQVKILQDTWIKLFDPKENRRIIQLTRGAIRHSYVSIKPFVNFFPPDCVGASWKKRGKGTPIRLRVEGIGVIETDIAEPNMRFRHQACVSFFFKYPSSQEG